MNVSVKREAARAMFSKLEEFLRADEVLADKACARMMMEKEEEAHHLSSKKRFDLDKAFRERLLYDRIDEFLDGWLRRREIKTDPFQVFRYEGKERGPTQHETVIGPSQANIERMQDRLAEAVPEIPDCRKAVKRAKTKVIAPPFRFQFPLPFGAVGTSVFHADLKALQNAIYEATLFTATGGDANRGWHYDAGLVIAYGPGRVRELLGELWDPWPEIHERIFEAARVWVILL